MNKSAIRNFAVAARAKLKEQIKDKAAIYGITEKEIKKIELFGDGFRVGGKIYDKTTLAQYRQLVRAIEQKGFDNVVEEVAYTWFNRFVALRFMEVNEYIPFNIHTKVLAGVEGKNEPEIISVSKDLELVAPEIYYSCLDKGDIEGLYKTILINLCNKLSKIMPNMFEKISDYTELLLPDHLYTEGGIINLLVSSIAEEDFTDQVEIIGWLYQFYISEKKAQVDEAVAKGKKVSKEDLPAKTQLFTPDWIVKYLVENSLGRLWLEKGDENSPLKKNWKYYLDGELIKDGSKLSPEEIKIIDPACGSGHMLVYAFDVLYDIYVSCGYPERDIPQLILEKNIYGIDIDERAAQLAYFALIMKARSKNRRLFRKEEPIKVNVCSIKESNGIAAIERPAQSQLRFDDRFRQVADYLIKTFYNAREYGSILKVEILDYDGLLDYVDEISHQGQMDIFDSAFINRVVNDMPDLIRQARILSQKYDVYITNPPYLGKGMSPLLSDYVKKNYPDSKSDLFAVFMELPLLKQGRYLAMINQHSWMFLSSYESLREKILQSQTITSMIHLGPRAFEEISGEVVQSTAFVMSKVYISGYQGTYTRLVDISDAGSKEYEFLSGHHRYVANSGNFMKIPGQAIAYWLSEELLKCFDNKLLGFYGEPRQGFATGDNERFLRLWYEVNRNKCGLDLDSYDIALKSNYKWYPCNKGGTYRKWYGNNEIIANWENNGSEMTAFSGSVIRNPQYYFKKGLTWSSLANNLSVRYSPDGFLFESKGSVCFIKDDRYLFYFLGLLNSKCIEKILLVLSPTLDFHEGPMSRVPVCINDKEIPTINTLVQTNISHSRIDWDAFETSWDFKRHPLTRGCNVAEAFESWKRECEERFQTLKANEEELNRIFIEIYGLQDELTPEVADEDITVRRADLDRDIRSLISYAVGCMFGRYSLDREGLVYAGGEFSDQWVVVSGKYYLREVVEKYVGKELSRINRMAEGNGFGGGDISTDQEIAEGRALCTVRPDEKVCSVHSIQYSGRSSKDFNQGIYSIPFNSTGLKGGAGNTAFDLCSAEILKAIGSGDGSELIARGWENAQHIDWKAIHYALTTNHYGVDEDNIIPITDQDFFENDIVSRFIEFVEKVYGTETLEENLTFIAKALKPTSTKTARQIIREYFFNDFFKDHCKIYKKRPIYWQFETGSAGAMKALVYLHRMDEFTPARVRTDYLHPLMRAYEGEIKRIDQMSEDSLTAAEKASYRKQKEDLQKKTAEIMKYDPVIAHIASRRIKLDLDDGVAVNYQKYQNVEVVEDGKPSVTANLLTKI